MKQNERRNYLISGLKVQFIGVTKVNQVEEAKAARAELAAGGISHLERLGDETGVHTY